MIQIPDPIPPCAPVHGPAERAALPQVEISDFGAVPDGVTLNTVAIQAAIDHCLRAGGGTVVVPAGRWLTGGLRLGSHLTLELRDQAVLLGSTDWRDYGTGQWCEALLTAERAVGLRIRGPGLVDGQDCFNPAGENHARGPHGLWLEFCRDVVVGEITFRNIGNWGVAAWRCTDLTFERFAVRGGHDGIDLENCQRVVVGSCWFESGDDCIAGPGNSDVRFHDCTFNSSCNALRVSCERMRVQRCRFDGPGRYEHRFTNGRTNTLAAFVHFSPHERGYRGNTPHSDHWLIEDCAVEGIDCLYEYDHGHVWQDGRGVGAVVFRRCRVRGLVTPIILYGSMRGYRRECRLFLDEVHLETRPGFEDCGFIDARRHGQITLRRVTLARNGSSRPIRTLDGGPVEVEDLRVEACSATAAGTSAEALSGVSNFVFTTEPLAPADDPEAYLHLTTRFDDCLPAGSFRDGPVIGRWFVDRRGRHDILVVWSTGNEAEIAVRGAVESGLGPDGEPLPLPPRPSQAERPDRTPAIVCRVGARPILLQGTGLEIIAA